MFLVHKGSITEVEFRPFVFSNRRQRWKYQELSLMACSWPVFSCRLIMYLLLMFVWFSTLLVFDMKWKTVAVWCPYSAGPMGIMAELPVSRVRTASVGNSETSHSTWGLRWSPRVQKVVWLGVSLPRSLAETGAFLTITASHFTSFKQCPVQLHSDTPLFWWILGT